ncbi:hypothetical protein DL764_003049 [Monosporascus ibericus]|uniref:Digeranylgeranylglyceryl phosphate synthase n=1 Tax=Monosporascus ibericus TaxID=155417 RepID=A0A4Q4TLD2_9PEZI|nr:hypothetical protein DL764_003049 [Monosporascus ibericus]
MSETLQVRNQTQTSALDAKDGPKSSARTPCGAVDRVFSRTGSFLTLFWLLTESNAPTFVGPNTMFGICGAASGSWLISVPSSPPSALEIAKRLGLVVLFNWSNLIVFDLANQRLPESAREDALNKPWRPVPRGLITSDQIRRTMLYLVPVLVALNHFLLGTGVQSLVIMVLTWLYNDLRGGDDSFVGRNAIIAAAFAVYNYGSLKVAVGANATSAGLFSGLTTTGATWVAIISLVIFTTMHVQDLQDQEGDRTRGRRSAPLVLGDWVARWTVAVPMVIWPAFCTWFWKTGLLVGAPQADRSRETVLHLWTWLTVDLQAHCPSTWLTIDR